MEIMGFGILCGWLLYMRLQGLVRSEAACLAGLQNGELACNGMTQEWNDVVTMHNVNVLIASNLAAHMIGSMLLNVCEDLQWKARGEDKSSGTTLTGRRRTL